MQTGQIEGGGTANTLPLVEVNTVLQGLTAQVGKSRFCEHFSLFADALSCLYDLSWKEGSQHNDPGHL